MTEPPRIIIEVHAAVPRFVWIAVAVAVVLVGLGFLFAGDAIQAWASRP